MKVANKYLGYILFTVFLLNPVISPFAAALSYFSASNTTVKELYKFNKKRKNKVFTIGKISNDCEEKQKEPKHKKYDLIVPVFSFVQIISSVAQNTVSFYHYPYIFTGKLFIL